MIGRKQRVAAFLVDRNRDRDGNRARFEEQCTRFQKRVAMVEHTVYEKSVPAAHGLGRTHAHRDYIGAGFRDAIAAQTDEFHLQIETLSRQGAHQIRGKDKSATQYRDGKIDARRAARDFARKPRDLARDLRFVEKNFTQFARAAKRSSMWRAADGGLESLVRNDADWPGASVGTPGAKLQW